MAWIVTYDYLENKIVEVIGPSTITREEVTRLKAGEGHRFRMFDDDGGLYYEGRSLEKDVFDPLDDYGTPNAGCTTIWYADNKGEYIQL